MDYLLGIILALVSLVCWAVSDVVAKVSLERTSKWKILFIGQLVGALLIAMVGFLFGGIGDFRLDGICFLIVVGFINFLSMAAFYKAIESKGLTLTSPIANSWAWVTIVLGVVFYNEVLSAGQIIAASLITGGIMLTTIKKGERIVFDRTFIFAAASMLLWGLFFFILKIPGQFYSAVLVIIFARVCASAFSLPVIIAGRVNLLDIRMVVFLAICLIGLLDTAGYYAYVLAAEAAPVSIIAPIASSVPALGVLLGVIALKEKITARQAMGVASTIAGIIIISL